MNKLAIFVEGQTELLFAESLLLEVAGTANLAIEKRRMLHRKNGRRIMSCIEASAGPGAKKYFVMIVDCGSDERVKSDILERYDGIAQQGYQAIIGIRDVYPQFKRQETAGLRTGLRMFLKTSPIEVLFVLGVMEIEAWFIAEHTHFQRIAACLTAERVTAELGLDPSLDDVSLLEHPAESIDRVYRLGGLSYTKRKSETLRTIRALDYASVYLTLPNRIADLRALSDALTKFLS